MPAPARQRSWIATYRLQLHADFTLADAGRVLPYLEQLGISHVYLSPCLQATRGSQHGYDVTDPRRISEDLGGEAAWAKFVANARARRVGILLDIVPNHMAATAQNPWWDDVLCHGPYSRYCRYFDIRMPVPSRFCVHICSLARPYGEALVAGELKIEVRRDEAERQRRRAVVDGEVGSRQRAFVAVGEPQRADELGRCVRRRRRGGERRRLVKRGDRFSTPCEAEHLHVSPKSKREVERTG